MAISRMQQAKQLLALGGRIGLQEGGIMPRLNQLGSGVSSAEQTLQEINQRLESAESSLGSGGGNQMPSGFGANRPVPEFMQSKPQNLEPLQQVDPNSPLLGIFPSSRPENTTGLTATIPPGTTPNLEELYPNAGQNQINFFRPENSTLRSGIPAASYADGGRIGLQGGGRDAAQADFDTPGPSGSAGDNRSDFMGSKGKTRGKTRGPSNVGNVGSVLSPAAPRLIRSALINQALRKAFGPVGPIVGGVVGAMSRGLPGTSEEDDDTQSFAGGGLAQLDTNRLAVKLLADGGFLGEEDRQAYGLGSIVRKITRPIKKVIKKATKTVKKVAKSPTGRLLLAVAAPYALGPAMANAGFLTGLSAAQKAALISGATTGVTQLASGEGLDLKDIAVSAALAGGTAKMFPGNIPGKAPTGVDPSSVASRARVAGDISATTPVFGAGDALGGEMLTRGVTSDPSVFTPFTKAVTNPQGIEQVFRPEQTGILKSLTDSVRNIGDSKVLQLAKDYPFLTILGASGLAGLTAKQEEELGETDRGEGIDTAAIRRRPFDFLAPRFGGSQFDFYDTAMAAEGGRIGYQKGSKEPVAKKVMPLLDMGGMEKDYREEGGFVPIGRMEKADDVPARLSKNEFVFTADAVRNAGDGDVDKGAEVMYNMMKNLEAGGDVSEESQGLQGARRMFQTSQRLEEVL